MDEHIVPRASVRVGATKCTRCSGTGDYYRGPGYEPFGLVGGTLPDDGVCYQCEGTGFTRIDDAGNLVSAPMPETELMHWQAWDDDDDETKEWARLLTQFRDQHGPAVYRFLIRLSAAEPDRYAKALASLRAGRGADVAKALSEWWLERQYRPVPSMEGEGN